MADTPTQPKQRHDKIGPLPQEAFENDAISNPVLEGPDPLVDKINERIRRDREKAKR